MSSLYTLSTLETMVWDRLESNSTFFTKAEVDIVINEAINCVNAMTGFFQGTATTTNANPQLLYQTGTLTLPSGAAAMLYPQRVAYDGVQLDPIAITRIGQDYPSWATDTVSARGAVARWVPIGIGWFALHPIDNVSTAGTRTISVTGVMQPTPLASGTDAMSLDDEYASIVIDYCAHRLPLKQGGKCAADAARIYQAGFLPAMKKLTNLQQMRMPRFWVNQGSPVAEGQVK